MADRNWNRNPNDQPRDYRTRDYGQDWNRDYNPDDYQGDRGDYSRDYGQGWRGNYNRDYGYSYTGDYTRDNDPDWDRGFDRDMGRDRPGVSGRMIEPTYYSYTEWWIIPGPYTGMGPKGYHRSDDRICEDICDRLAQHGQIDASDVQVKVDDGVVTLDGSVDDRRQKRMAEDVAESVSGVKDIQNHLRVSRHQGKERDKNRFGQHQQTGQMSQDQRQFSNLGSEPQGEHMAGSNPSRGRINEGMHVFGANGDDAGTVKEVRANDFLLDRSMARDIYVPMSAVQSVSGDRIQLNVRADQIDNQGWAMPEIVGSRANMSTE